MKQRIIFIGAAVLLVLVFVFASSSYKTQQTEQATAAATRNKEALVRFHSPTLGQPGAAVHIVEFLDPACETCRAFYPVVKAMLAENSDKIRLSIRYAPFHRGADEIVKLLEAARKQGKYWETLAALLAAQAQWAPDHAAHLDLVWPVIDGLGLDMARLRVDMQAPELTRLIEQDLADAKTLNVQKTPEFFVNGRPLPSFGLKQLQDLVAEELAVKSN
ncbi:MAG: DsbA family protein [Azonexus sp.]|jgi:protein-disulfide isomerase|nr:DsbA family protein [Azonexus sp.]